MSYDLHNLYNLTLGTLQNSPRATISALSVQLGVDRHTLEKAVKSATGGSFRELQNQTVLKTARAFISGQPGSSAKEISYALGYGSPRSFARFIRGRLGITPTRFRSRLLRAHTAPQARARRENRQSVPKITKLSSLPN